MTNTICSYGTSMSIFCIYNLKNHTFNERERERERARERERERQRERGREREMDFHSFLDPFSSVISMPLLPCPWIWVPCATRRCGLARGGSPSAALTPATAGTRRASEAWQPRGNSPESLLEETNQESLTHQTWFQSGLHSLAPCCQERLFSKGHKDVSLSLLRVCVCVCVCERERERERGQTGE